MRQGYDSINTKNEKGIPTGGLISGVGIDIKWQEGPLGRDGDRIKPNGAFVEDVINACKQRLEFYNNSQFKCRENSIAITKLDEALMWLEHRTKDREARGVEGTHSI